MPENLLYMQTEDGMVSFERDDGSTIIYPLACVPESFKEGDIIVSIVHSEDFIEFIELDVAEMEARRARVAARAARIRARAKRSTETDINNSIVDSASTTNALANNSEN